jgi:hypothetical protein
MLLWLPQCRWLMSLIPPPKPNPQEDPGTKAYDQDLDQYLRESSIETKNVAEGFPTKSLRVEISETISNNIAFASLVFLLVLGLWLSMSRC